MSYQADPENLKEIEVNEEATFFSSTNKWRMFALFMAAVVATCVVLATKGASPVSITMLSKKSSKNNKTFVKKMMGKDVLQTPSTVEEMLEKYGLMFDRSKMFKNKNKSSYGKFNPKRNPLWGAPSKSYFYAMTMAGSSCSGGTPYSVMGMSLNECMPLGAATDDDYTSQMGVVITCDGSITMNIFQDQSCAGDAIYSFALANDDACYGSDSTSTYVTCSPMDFSSYSYDIQKVWVSVGEEAVNQCDSSDSAANLDSEMFEAYPADVCVPQAITESDYSFVATNDNGNPSVIVYEEDNCQGDSYPVDLDPSCESGVIKDNIYGATKYQYNTGR